jgi:hypothetical protein
MARGTHPNSLANLRVGGPGRAKGSKAWQSGAARSIRLCC